jgi:hypothetical protein
LRFLSSGLPGSAVDYPTVATGSGRNANEQSVWFGWRAATGDIQVTGAAVTGKGVIGQFIGAESVTGSNGMALPRAQVGPNGQVMVSFHTVGDPNGTQPTQIYVNVDDDGLGANGFRANAKAVAQSTIVVSGQAGIGFRIPAQPNRGITPQVSLAWDHSGIYGDATNGRVYMVYTTGVAGTINDPDTDIYVRYSDDSGKSWSIIAKLVSGNDLMSQFLPSIAVDQTDGDIAVVWLDARDDNPGNAKVALYGTLSFDGGATFQTPFKIAAGSSNASNADRLQRGTSTGNNGTNTLSDTTQTWIGTDYWRNNFEVEILGNGPAAGQFRGITASTKTMLIVDRD